MTARDFAMLLHLFSGLREMLRVTGVTKVEILPGGLRLQNLVEARIIYRIVINAGETLACVPST
jgi:hypothetical protein